MSALRDGIHLRACNLCEAICGLAITVEGGAVVDLRGDAADVFSKGHICPKGSALIDLHADPDRLTAPLRRRGTQWEPIGWDDAYDLVVRGLQDVVARCGDDAVAIYLGNPNVHNSGTMLSSGGFLRALRTRNRFSATSVDQLPHHRAALEMFGHPLLLPIPDVDRTDHFLVLGANPLVSNGSMLTAPGMRDRVRAIRERGGRVIVIDPRRSETAAAADEHHFIRPGTDALFLLALMNAIDAAGEARLGRLTPFTDGFDALRAAARAFPPERVAAPTGIDAATIRRIARAFASAPRAVAYGRIGLSTQPFGGLCQWLLNALNAVTENLDAPGGAMWPLPAFDLLQGAKRGQAHAGRWRSRARGLPEFDGEFPVATLIDELRTPGPGRVRAFVTVAGNPVLSTPSGAELDAALADLEFMVSVDPYLNETTRHADVILPPAIGLEVEHYDVIFHHLAVRNTARYSEAIAVLDESQRYDWQIFEALRLRMTGATGAPPHVRIDRALRAGPYRTNLDDVRAHPHGVDYGPPKPVLPERLLTADSRVQLAPPAMLADLPRLETMFAEPPPALSLIGRRQLRSNNSWMHNAPRLMRGGDRCTLQLHPLDADARAIGDGDRVEVRSRTGAVVVPAEITDAVMPGVVSLPHGFGHGHGGTRLSVASETPGASINDLTDRERIDELTGNAAFSGTPVEVVRYPA
ncbi:oxidoreductase [Vulcanimicrobium alpinum]|uniref:Oxidoreductase n=1 Tax=Vulcanimicrobium alpinum TaxID=3016050 RepID=A0AAN1XX54_UNVUL|nr:molybdopterin dinucleotide binding domain-containing protein [Vulcanimicrobium alpinum]BDE05902.1 oxidoreductase [Vulcanimicrobium alpinum]